MSTRPRNRPSTYRRGWGIHFCPLDADCRRWGAPARLNLITPWLCVGVALSPGARMMRRGKWRWVAWWK